jgi:Tfp pilus assembly protein PilN
VRPVNLIPQEDRRGAKAPLRTGPLSYAIVAILLLALGGVTLLVLTGNKISDRKAEVASLQSQVDAAQAQADQLSTYTHFADLQQARQETVASLASSRFDWERTLHELALVLPGDVWLTTVTASAAADPSSSTSSSTTAVDGVTGPSLDINGCASGHDAVAKFLAALRDIDGVTRVTVLSSDRPGAQSSTNSSTSSSSASSGQGTVECASRDFIATFEVVAAFDGAQPAATTPPASPGVPVTSTTTTTSGEQATTQTQPQPTGSGGGSSSGGASASAVVSNNGGTP